MVVAREREKIREAGLFVGSWVVVFRVVVHVDVAEPGAPLVVRVLVWFVLFWYDVVLLCAVLV